jgi:hypothetical protein
MMGLGSLTYSRKSIKLLSTTISLLLIFTGARAQEHYLQFDFGMGTYSMKTLKSIYDYSGNSEVALQTVENFDPFWCYGFKYGKRFEKLEYGLKISFYST